MTFCSAKIISRTTCSTYPAVRSSQVNCPSSGTTSPSREARRASIRRITVLLSSQGDSGGPATFREKNGRYTLEGVTSYGPPICTIGGLPTIYTRISAYLDWIKFSIFHVFSSGR